MLQVRKKIAKAFFQMEWKPRQQDHSHKLGRENCSYWIVVTCSQASLQRFPFVPPSKCRLLVSALTWASLGMFFGQWNKCNILGF